ncbi:alpha/beta fold hydrolase [Pelomonas sp. KK5]|uniref:alpha/beta fold hydrolase n=1 Tax=Pelomonas sp. KK5 TaxID=1855730 RepID=UPI00097BD014|nr:alpha/beta hydrolase [Pelomonas sp. KK5]
MTIETNRRSFLSLAAAGSAGVALSGLAGRASALVPGEAFGPIRQIRAGLLDVGYVDLGPRDGPPVMLFHGWPYDIHTYEQVAPRLAAQGFRVIVPHLRGYGSTRFLSASTLRSGQQTALAADTIALMDALGIRKAIMAGCDWGARNACVVSALWPERCQALVSVSGFLVLNPATVLTPLQPADEFSWWYQYYFATERGRIGYEKNLKAFARFIWRQASPKWNVDDATFDRCAESLVNPDQVAIVIHNYRWRVGAAEGDPQYDALEARLAKVQSVALPSITLEGDANGAPHPAPAAYASRFTGRYEHRNLGGGIGHNLPQEAPEAFAQAIVDVSRW